MNAIVTISPSGVVPKEVTVARGGTVTFVNDNTRPHDIFSDPDHAGTDCPAVNNVGFLVPGRRGETAPLEIVRRCGYHDHFAMTDQAFRGVIVVVEPTSSAAPPAR
jgi:plastocyanin